MLSRATRYLARHEPRTDWRLHIKSSAGAFLGVLVVGGLSAWSGLPLLIAPLGPTALLMFAQPEIAPSQPVAIFAGYFLGATFASIMEVAFPGSWWAAVLAVGLVMLTMLMLRVTHPPAAAVPLVVYSSPIAPQVLFLVMLTACVVLTGLALAWHRIPPRVGYPRWSPAEPETP
ncbi:hypothetical protein VE25_14730 [Devosia geojensis]|uniref:HPP transmembrane region domain-containing protein n=1 Tax=Devosia geojensis TaxID=443610 RepID=A0A0F5FSB1_9HYPH|nr:HPP family protein [Devosia geojensis]KKB11037.1 hypothetical protein VE25_14730 [Devosia geojensis]